MLSAQQMYGNSRRTADAGSGCGQVPKGTYMHPCVLTAECTCTNWLMSRHDIKPKSKSGYEGMLALADLRIVATTHLPTTQPLPTRRPRPQRSTSRQHLRQRLRLSTAVVVTLDTAVAVSHRSWKVNKPGRCSSSMCCRPTRPGLSPSRNYREDQGLPHCAGASVSGHNSRWAVSTI